MELNKIYQGDCLKVMKTFPDNSIDTIITDPPYHLTSIVKRFGKKGSAPAKYGTDGTFQRASKGFMGKEWDGGNIAFTIELWQECLRVLKPGGTLLSFGGSRTYHRMACAVEDAGFILKDCIMWLYGCLSEDTEILTERGWKHLRKTTKYDKIKIYDIKNNIYKWETPQRWTVYSVNKDTCYRIKSDTTDQIVSKKHRCLVKREGKFVFKQAWELDKMERVPILSQDFFSEKKGNSKLLFKKLLWKNKGLAQTIFSKWQRKEKTRKGLVRRQKPSLEGRSDLFQEEGQLWKIQNKIYSLSERIFGYGSERRLCYGTSVVGSTRFGQMFNFKRSNTSQRPQSREQQYKKSDVIQEQQTPQITRSTITKIEYTGKLFCPTVSTGAFVARRNGQVFITGNSGFPKATDISKQLDKLNGKKPIDKGPHPTINGKGDHFEFCANYNGARLTEPATPEAKLWNGWKSHGLKPAYEPVIWATKSLTNNNNYAILNNINQNIGELVWQLLVNIQKQDIFKSQEMVLTSLSIVLLWNDILAELLKKENKSTISTELKTITELKILNSLLLRNTPEGTDGKSQTSQNGIQKFQVGGSE